MDSRSNDTKIRKISPTMCINIKMLSAIILQRIILQNHNIFQSKFTWGLSPLAFITGWPVKFKSQIPGVFQVIFKKIPGEIKTGST